ncbi:carboxypeptidase regulatory-like domain-containing protein [Enhygromyxa salina]|uniref:PDZ domain-containing protein n=1 Tax=Enhygromyxa salina TaxID=215803 RepID=A0A2S9YDV6_9BACT|nr:carboxypeptidase regulatory-like domain-containing protein [Enhygromyxa salina]PRQ03191.1 hypothetical protein ENSA7_53310 [Enhygromyxa salina]
MSDRKQLKFGVLAAIVVILGLGAWWLGANKDDSGTATAEQGATKQLDLGARPVNSEPLDSGTLLLRADKAVVSGTILDDQGRGIAGATVCAWADQSALRGAGDGRPRCVKSEHDGHYRLEDLWPVPTSIGAGAPEFRPGRWSERVDGRVRYELRLHPGQEVRDTNITLERGGVAIRGVVKDISGGVIDGALVGVGERWGFNSSSFVAALSDDEGRFELWTDPGVASLNAQAQGYASARTDSAAPTEQAEIFMTPESTITGTVVHAETGAPVPHATVVAKGARFASGGRGAAITDGEGQFQITGLEPGVYDVIATTDELYGETVEQIHLGLAQAAEGTIVMAHPAASLTGKVVIAETGAPCTDGSVRLDAKDLRQSSPIDEQGGVVVRALLPGEYEVEIRCDGYMTEPRYEPIIITDQNLIEVEWRVHTGLAIRGVVVDSNGDALANIHVRAAPKLKPGADPRGQQTSSWGRQTEADGSFELQGLLPGSYELTAASADYPGLDEPLLVELSEAADLEGVRLELPATGRLVGIVRDEAGAGVAGISVSVRGIDSHSSETTQTGDDGRFVFERLRPGGARVRAHGGWFEDMRAPGSSDDDVQGEVVDIAEGHEAEVELVVETRNGTISGRVVDGDGGPVTDAFIDATRISDSAAAGASSARGSLRWGWGRKPMLSDHDGAFELRDLSEGSYMLRAYRKGGGEAIVEDVEVGASGVVLTIVETGQIAGKVVFAGGQTSPERFEVRVVDKAAAFTRRDSFFRSQGVFAMRELPPGTYEIAVSATGGAASTTVELAAGASVDDVQIELQAMITVTGRLVDADTRAPVPGHRVTISARNGSMNFGLDDKGEQRDVSGADGRFEVEDVPTGRVNMMILPRDFTADSDYGWNHRSLTLAAEPSPLDIGDIELLVSRLDKRETGGDLGFKTKPNGPEVEPEDEQFEVAVIRPGGPAAASGLAPGDQITAVDGRGVTGLDSHRYNKLTRAPPGTKIQLTIEGKPEVTIVLGPPVEW